jgi:hypothetical protein
MTPSHEVNGKFALGHAKLGGRKKGTVNKAVAVRQLALFQGPISANDGEGLVDFLSRVYQDVEQSMHHRLAAARVLMQYAYQRLSAISANSAAQPLGVTIIRFSGLPAVEQHTIDGFDN